MKFWGSPITFDRRILALDATGPARSNTATLRENGVLSRALKRPATSGIRQTGATGVPSSVVFMNCLIPQIDMTALIDAALSPSDLLRNGADLDLDLLVADPFETAPFHEAAKRKPKEEPEEEEKGKGKGKAKDEEDEEEGDDLAFDDDEEDEEEEEKEVAGEEEVEEEEELEEEDEEFDDEDEEDDDEDDDDEEDDFDNPDDDDDDYDDDDDDEDFDDAE